MQMNINASPVKREGSARRRCNARPRLRQRISLLSLPSLLRTRIEHIIMLKRNKQTVGLVLIVVFAFYYANTHFFYHSHIVNGATIVHSHIYNKMNAQAATHSMSELTLISVLSIFHSLQASACFVNPGVLLLLLVIILPSLARQIILNPVACICLRAPPSSSLLPAYWSEIF